LTYRRLLAGNADFRRLWAGQVVSEVGDWLNNIAVLALAIELAGPDRQGRAIAVYAVARHLPLFLFGPVAGVVTDRVDRKRLMVAADIIRAALALGFLLAPVWGSLPVIYVVGASLFSVAAFFNAAKRATLPNLVATTEELLAANSLSAATTAGTIAAGSAVGGLVATFAGRETVFLLNAATFVASAELIRRIRRPTSAPRAAASPEPTTRDPRSAIRRVFVDFREGLRYVRTDAVLAAAFVVATGWGLGNGAARALYSIFGARLGELSASGWLARPKDFGISVLFVAMGLGGVLGAPLARRFNSAGTSLGARMGRSLLADGAGLFVFALMPSLWSAALVLVAREVNFAVWWTAQQTLIMRRTDNRFAGRVFATHEAVTTLAMVGSIYLAGASADRFGIRPVAAAGGACIALSGALWFILRGRTDEHEVARKEELQH
jgi:MFS family permease